MANPLNSVSPGARRVLVRLVLDLPLSVPAAADYGVESPQHYRALREAVSYYPEAHETQAEIDAALRARWQAFERIRCNGKAITAFVEQYAPQFKGLTFLSWDEVGEAFEEEYRR